MHQQLEKTIPVRTALDAWRGVAILAVLLIHVLASIPLPTFTPTPVGFVAILLDQLARFSVPVFLSLSGYGLVKKYENSLLNVWQFWRARFTKLLPLYLLWSAILLTLFQLVPYWQVPPMRISKPGIVEALLFGQADYHLYFIPLIFSFYLLFPVLLRLLRINAQAFLLSTFLLQIAVVLLIELLPWNSLPSFFNSDQEQYLFVGSWIFYFAFGMYLANRPVLDSRTSLLQVFPILAGALVAFEAFLQIASQQDPLLALRFTRPIVFVFASLTIFFILRQPLWLARRVPSSWHSLLETLGQWSFPLYLAHTLFLRLLFSPPPHNPYAAGILGLLFLGGGVWISVLLLPQTNGGNKSTIRDGSAAKP